MTMRCLKNCCYRSSNCVMHHTGTLTYLSFSVDTNPTGSLNINEKKIQHPCFCGNCIFFSDHRKVLIVQCPKIGFATKHYMLLHRRELCSSGNLPGLLNSWMKWSLYCNCPLMHIRMFCWFLVQFYLVTKPHSRA